MIILLQIDISLSNPNKAYFFINIYIFFFIVMSHQQLLFIFKYHGTWVVYSLHMYVMFVYAGGSCIHAVLVAPTGSLLVPPHLDIAAQ